jgi:hypothetical protein
MKETRRMIMRRTKMAVLGMMRVVMRMWSV